MTEVKKQLFEQLALVAQSLASPQRIELLDYLAQSERTVEELSQLSGLSFANTSRHLQVLKNHGLVLMQKQGKTRVYTIAGPDVVLLIRSLRQTSEKHRAEVGRLLSGFEVEPDFPKKISQEALLSHLEETDFLVIDVRPEKEFAQGHIKGAMNVPPNQIQQVADVLPKDKTLVAYCRGPYCVYSYQLLDALRERGIKAYQMQEGFPEWKAEGLPWESKIQTSNIQSQL